MNDINKNILIEYADYLMKIAVYKTGNICDAEDLVQDTLLAALAYLERGRSIDNVKNWLSSVLDRKFYDSIRRKYRKPTVSMDITAELAEEAMLYEAVEKSEDAENIRRCVSMLTKNYREVIIRHYMNGESVKDIAGALNVPENTVKSRLYTGRRHIGKEFEMENYTKQSYQPETLWIGCTGESGLNDEPFSLVGHDKIKMNLLILAYEKPITIPQLAGAIGIPTAYVEPIVEDFIKSELMGRVGDKVYTDFIITGEKERLEYLDAQIKTAQENYREIWEVIDSGLAELRKQNYYKAQRDSAKLKLESHFVIRTVEQAVNSVRNEACGGLEAFSDYRRRPDGGRWYAIGNRYPDNYDNTKSRHIPYGINGEWGTGIFDFLDTKHISLTDYDTVLCRAHNLYSGNYRFKQSALKMLYAVYTHNKDAFSAVDKSCIDSIDEFIKMDYLSKDADGKLICEVPVISVKERDIHYALTEKYKGIIAERFHGVFMALMENPQEISSHVKSYPKWLRYNTCCCYLPMAVVLAAREEGLYDNTSAAVYIECEK